MLVVAKNHLRGRGGCKKCSSRLANLSSKEEFIAKAKLIHHNKYDYSLVDYKNSNTKIKIICNTCKNVFEQTPKAHLQNENCPYCKHSLKEEIILNYLKQNNIKFEYQKRFKDLLDKKYLSYDFYLPDKNLLIEYNGEQHYNIIDYFGGRKRFLLQKHHDWLKRKYAKKHQINLLTITYKDDIINTLKENLNG